MIHALKTRSARLLARSSMAIALMCGAQEAQAQSFQGSGVVVEGAATIVDGAGTTSVNINSDEVVIDWTPFDTAGAGTIDFQPTGTTADFFASALQTFTVLNRILPVDGTGNPVARAISLDGTVNSFLPGSPNLQTGAIWFYSPTGIIVGQNATFNVGSLVLTTNDITFGVANTGNTILFGPGDTIQFRGPVDSTGFVQVDPGAQINAAVDQQLGLGSYVAMVAPRVVQGGTVNANGSIAYVAAEQADIAINAGLFDIQILSGTTDPNGVVHTGTSTGPASTGLADQRIVTMMALPKNTALTMLLSGTIGYGPAAVAANDGSAVVLSAGYDIPVPATEAPSNLGNIQIGSTVFSNRLQGFASNSITVSPTGGLTDFQAATSLFAQQSVSLIADAGETIQTALGANINSSESGVGGAIDIIAQGGDITIGGPLFADASSTTFPFFTTTATNGVGGNITVSASGGTVSIVDTFLSAQGRGFADALPTGGTDGIGGSIDLVAGPGGTLSLGNITAQAEGIGGFAMQFGGDGFGGSISVLGQGGFLDFGTVGLFASGIGESGDAGGGSGTGGQIVIDIASQAHNWDFLRAEAIAAGAFPNFPGTSGGSAIADPNAITLNVTGGASLNVAGFLELNADGNAGYDGAGIVGQAGGIAVNILGGDVDVAGQFYVHANGNLGFDPPAPLVDIAPVLTGGTVDVALDSGNLAAVEMLVQAEATGFGGITAAGTGTGGTATVALANGSNLTLAGVASGDQLEISADALGTSAPIGGTAIAGSASLVSDSSQVNIAGPVLVTASTAPSFLDQPLLQPGGFIGTAGSALIDLSNTEFIIGDTLIAADGVGGAATIAGTGTGGSASFVASDTLTGTATRTLASLSLGASGVDGTGAFDTAGTTALTVGVLSATAPISVLGNFDATALGATAPAGDGFSAAISGQPFSIGGNALVDTSRDVTMTITPPGSFDVSGTFDINARQVSTSGPITVGGNSAIIAPNGISMTDLAVGGATLLQAVNGPVAVSNDLSSVGQVIVEGTSVNLRALSTLGILDAQATAGDLVLSVNGATGDLIITQATATGAVNGSSTNGAVAVNGPVTGSDVTLSSGTTLPGAGDISATTGALVLDAGTALATTGTLDAATDASLSSGTTLDQSGALTAGGNATLAAGTDLANSGPISAGGAATLTAGGSVQNDTAISAGGNTSITAGSDLASTSPINAGGSASFSSGGDSIITGDVTAATTVDFTGSGTLAVDSAIAGTAISGSSSQIDLGANAQVGAAGTTQTVSLTNNSAAGDTFVGGADQPGEYSLTQAEIDTISADAAITVSSTGSGLFTVGDLAVATGAGGSLGDGGTLALASAGDINVTGTAVLVTDDPASTFSLTGQEILVSADTGSLVVADAAGALSGVLDLAADSVIVLSSAALADLGAGADVTTATDRLGIADGTPGDAGYVQADTINVDVTSRLYIQNSGTSDAFDDRRGFTANALNINTAAPGAQIAINGVILDASGNAVTGLDTTARITVNGAPAAPGGQFDPFSTVNGCIIGLDCRIGLIPVDPKPKDELTDLPGDDGDGSDRPGIGTLIEVRESEPLITPPLIDEPITGVGNDDLWIPECEPGEENDACIAEEPA